MRYEVSGSIRPILERRPAPISQFDMRENWWPTFHHPEKRYECSEYVENSKSFTRSEINEVKKENPIISNLKLKTKKLLRKKFNLKINTSTYFIFWGVVTHLTFLFLFMNL